MVSMPSKCITCLIAREGSCLRTFRSPEETGEGASKDLKISSTLGHLNVQSRCILFIEVAFSSYVLFEHSL